MAAILWAGSCAVASHRAAARIWEFEPFNGAPVEVTVPHVLRARHAEGIVHVGRLAPGCVQVRGGLPVTSPARTLLDLCSVVRVDRVELAMDCALRRGLVSVEQLDRLAASASGRRGIRGFRQLVEIRTGTGTTDSGLETRFLRVLVDGDVPLPIAQGPIVENGRTMARPDFSYPDLLLAIEVDSYGYHSAPREFQRDRTRQNYLVNRGWLVLRFSEEDLKNRKRYVVDSVLRARAERLRVLRAPA